MLQDTALAPLVRHHEAIHRQQAERSPNCTRWASVRQLLIDESEAYCTTEADFVARGNTQGEAVRRSLVALVGQFDGVFSPDVVIQVHLAACHHVPFDKES